jgi:hypothetical protein
MQALLCMGVGGLAGLGVSFSRQSDSFVPTGDVALLLTVANL